MQHFLKSFVTKLNVTHELNLEYENVCNEYNDFILSKNTYFLSFSIRIKYFLEQYQSCTSNNKVLYAFSFFKQ